MQSHPLANARHSIASAWPDGPGSRWIEDNVQQYTVSGEYRKGHLRSCCQEQCSRLRQTVRSYPSLTALRLRGHHQRTQIYSSPRTADMDVHASLTVRTPPPADGTVNNKLKRKSRQMLQLPNPPFCRPRVRDASTKDFLSASLECLSPCTPVAQLPLVILPARGTTTAGRNRGTVSVRL